VAERVAISPQGFFGLGSVSSGWHPLRLVQPWPPDDAATGRGERTWPEEPARPTSQPHHLALVTVAGPQLERPSAMVVMRQLLSAWRSAERQLDGTVEGSLEQSQIQAQIDGLRSSYQRVFAQVWLGLGVDRFRGA
jgi:hypothetical protein